MSGSMHVSRGINSMSIIYLIRNNNIYFNHIEKIICDGM